MILYHLQRLIKKYTVCCKLENTKEGEWVAGEWVEGETTTTDIAGAIVPMSECVPTRTICLKFLVR